jgi:hypothetical protein
MTEGVEGSDAMLRARAALVPQLLLAVTEREPEINDAEKLIITEFVPCPLLIEAFAGAIQL